MKHLLFISFILLSILPGCRERKMNAKEFTTANVIRHLPENRREQPTPTPKDTAVIEEKATPAPRPATDTTPIIPAVKTKSYHIIVASHPRQSLAEADVRKLREQGYNDACILQKDNRFRVSIAHFSNRNEALKERTRLIDTLGQDDLWVGYY